MSNDWGDIADDGEPDRGRRRVQPPASAAWLFLLLAVAMSVVIGIAGTWYFTARRAMDVQVRDAERALEAQVEQMERVPAK